MPIATDAKRNLLYAGLILAAIPIAGCNTVEGAGEDIESAGDAVEEAGEEAGEEMGD